VQLRSRLTILFAGITGCILLICSFAIYILSAQFREQDFEDRLIKKIDATARLYVDIEEVDARLLRIIQQQELGRLPNEQIQIFSLNGDEVYRSDEIRYFEVPLSFITAVDKLGNSYSKIENFEVFGKKYQGESGTFIVIAGGYDKFGFSKLRYLRNVLIIVTLGGILIFFLSGWFYTGRALSPISRVISQAEQMTPDNLGARLNEGNGNDELARMARTFNNLLDRIEASFILQKTFVANASHELRTPLTIITGQLEVVLMRQRDAAEYKATIESVLEDIKRLNLISNTLLLLAQAEKERTDISVKKIQVDELLWMVKSDITRNHSNYQISVLFKKTPENENDFTIEGNEQLLKTAVMNVAENACKFSDDKKAEIILDYNNSCVSIHIINQGKGIPEEELKLIFQPFFRSKTVTQHPGHGLGLAMVDKIIQLHHGEIEVESVLNSETRFTLKLPRLKKKH
jgi:signal transduction histidine kinase